MILASLLSSFAQAAFIHTASYDATSDSLVIDLTYGGCNLETFTPVVGPCMETFPLQTRLTLDDSRDNCRAIIRETLTLKVEQTGLKSCRPAFVGVGTQSNDSIKNVFVPAKPEVEASGIKCERDARPVDGSYEAIELVKNANGKYDAFYSHISAGFGGPVVNTRERIAKGLDCRFGSTDKLLSECLKSSSEEGEPTNSGFSLKHVQTTQVDGQSASYAITIFSPLLNANHGQSGFPHSEQKGWAKLEFNATPSRGVMVNRCVAN